MARNSERLYVARSGSSATNTTAVALVAATAKSVAGVLGSSTDTISLVRVKLSFDGVTPTAVPAIVEIGIISALGTMSSFTPGQLTGRVLASSCTAGYNATVEPTFVRLIDSFYAPVLMGNLTEWVPLGEEAVCDPSQGFAVRVTAPAVVNCLPSLYYAE
jgi:hypothetical protein